MWKVGIHHSGVSALHMTRLTGRSMTNSEISSSKAPSAGMDGVSRPLFLSQSLLTALSFAFPKADYKVRSPDAGLPRSYVRPSLLPVPRIRMISHN